MPAVAVQLNSTLEFVDGPQLTTGCNIGFTVMLPVKGTGAQGPVVVTV